MRRFNVKVNGQPYQVEVEEYLGGAFAPAAPIAVAAAPVAVAAAPAVQEAPVAAPKEAAVPAPVAAPADGAKLSSPMPGTVLDFKVANGATVKKGQVVLILEAMKMENDIVANESGVITFVASKGASVNSGDVLAVIA